MEELVNDRVKRGYLNEDFLFFNLKDKKKHNIEFHYHDFSKIIIFLSGDASYIIEGKTYKLKPWDVLLVPRNDIHMPVISPDVPYERIILWLNPVFLEAHNRNNCNLLTCFQLATERKTNLVRINQGEIAGLKQNLIDLDQAYHETSFGSEILKNALFIQLMVRINRLFLGMDTHMQLEDIKYDERIDKLIQYINNNLDGELSIELLAKLFYLNKYYLMHLFKKETGYTLYNYIQKKRIIKAADYVRQGIPAGEVCALCGFIDYSAFVRAFKKEFHLSPKQYYKSMMS